MGESPKGTGEWGTVWVDGAGSEDAAGPAPVVAPSDPDGATREILLAPVQRIEDRTTERQHP